MPSRLRAENLDCGYPPRAVLSGLNLEVEAGEVVSLLGPNGTGKSTLLRTLSATLPPIAGSVIVDGEPSHSLSDLEIARRVAVVPSEELPPYGFSVREIVLMGRLPYAEGIFDSDEDHRIAEDAMLRADCAFLAERAITEISAGERQRVLIARALAQQSKVLLLDEPTAHLDVRHQLDLIRLLRQLSQEGYSVVAAWHDLNLAAMLGGRGLLIHEGRAKINAAIDDLLTDPVLDDVYGVKFIRTRYDDGDLRVWPM